MASLNGHLDVVKLLLGAEGINVNQAEEDGCTGLYVASSEKGHLDVVKLLLGAEGINVNQAKNTGVTALSMATTSGHTDVVRLLLQQPNIDVNKGQEGWPPLKLAKHFKFTEIVQLLTDAGTSTNTSTGGTQQVRVTVPPNTAPGQTLRINRFNKQYDVKIPANCTPGTQFAVNLPL